jgi:hypothetical protein
MPQVVFEPTIPVFERAKTVLAIDRAATVIGIIKNTNRIFWGVTTLSVVEVIRRFGKTYSLYLQGRRMIGTSQQAGSSN